MTRTTIFSTNRLIIRTAEKSDVEMYFRLWNDPRVMANVGFPNGLHISRDAILHSLDGQTDEPFSNLLVAELKETNVVIGECKMYLPNKEGVSRTDVKLLPDHWGNRYGIEIKQGLVDYLFRNSDCAAVEGTPNLKNAASIKMQEAVGGVRIGKDVTAVPDALKGIGTPVHHYVYRVYRDRWESEL